MLAKVRGSNDQRGAVVDIDALGFLAAGSYLSGGALDERRKTADRGRDPRETKAVMLWCSRPSRVLV